MIRNMGESLPDGQCHEELKRLHRQMKSNRETGIVNCEISPPAIKFIFGASPFHSAPYFQYAQKR